MVFADSGCPVSACSTFVSRVACELAPVSPTRADWIAPFFTSSATATPTIA